jgi:superfamily II DNA or RNA helicase
VKTFGSISRSARDGSWIIDCEPHVMIRLKRLFGKVAKTHKGAAVLSDTPENGRELAWFCKRFPMDNAAPGYLAAREAQHVLLGETISNVLAGGYVPREFELAMAPREYQRVAADLALRTGRLLVGDDVGLGKTATAICALSDPESRPALVVTLTHLPRQWRAELAKFLPGASVHIIKKGTPYPINPQPDVLLINYSKLAGWQEALAGTVKTVVFDEVQELRRTGSDRYNAAAAIAFSAKLRIGLSATPVYNYAGEMHAIFEVLCPGALGTWAEFSREWCNGDMVDPKKAPVKNPRALGSYLREQGLLLRRTRQDVGRELPPLTTVPHTIDADLDEINKVASSAAELAQIILRQGGMGIDKMRASEELSWRLRQATGIAKAHFVAEFVRMLVESGEQVLLYGWHHEVYKIWQERLADLNPASYTGEESVPQKEAAKKAFIDGAARVLIMSLRAGAGVDGLQSKARTVVFGELDWSPGVHEQCIGRIYRDGQADPVVAYYLIADSGSDPVVADVLGVKRSQSDGVRDPNSALIEKSQGDPDRVRRLAEEFLKQRGIKRETAPPQTPAATPGQLQLGGSA